MKSFCPILLAFALAVTAACAQQPVEEDVPLYSQAELDQMLAPIALYPDELLSQLLMAATYPLEIVQAARWSRSHPELTGQDAVRAATAEPWDPSVKSMLAFPRILQQMDEDLDWTRSLGDAFLAQQEQVMDTVQALRARAQDAGNLQSNEQVEVVEEQRTIVVRHVYPDVAYVPYYDPWVVYGSWWWPSYRPVRWAMWPDYGSYYAYRGFYWGPAVVVGHGFFFSRCDWRYRRLRVVDVPPFYYRHPPPPDRVWHHDGDHRRGVPYRHQRVHDRYADPSDPVPRREPRERREPRDRANHDTAPAAAPGVPNVVPGAGEASPQPLPAADPTVRERRREALGDEPSVPKEARRERSMSAELPVAPTPQAAPTPVIEPAPRAPRTAPAGEPRPPRNRPDTMPLAEPRAPRATAPRAEPRAPRTQPHAEPRPPRNGSDVEASRRPATREAVARATNSPSNRYAAGPSPMHSFAAASRPQPAAAAFVDASPRNERSAGESRSRRSEGPRRRSGPDAARPAR